MLIEFLVILTRKSYYSSGGNWYKRKTIQKKVKSGKIFRLFSFLFFSFQTHEMTLDDRRTRCFTFEIYLPLIHSLLSFAPPPNLWTFRRSWAAVATTNNRGGRTNYAAWKKKVTFSGGDIQYYYCVLLCSCLRVHIPFMYWTWSDRY